MKLWAVILTIILSFSQLIPMHRSTYLHDQDLENIKQYKEKIHYYARQKDFPNVIKFLKAVRKAGNDFEHEAKKELQNEVIIILIRSLPISKVVLSLFEHEYYGTSNIESGLSSNDPSPRVEENGFTVSYDDLAITQAIKLYSLGKEAELKEILTSSYLEDQVQFSFLSRLIKKLENFNNEVLQAKSDLRIYCQNQSPKRFLEIFENYGKVLNLDDLNGSGSSIIHHIIENEKKPLLLFMLQEGASTEVRDLHGNTPLLQAIKRENIGLIKCLLKFGVNPYMSTKGAVGQHVLNRVGTEESLDPLVAIFYQITDNKNKIKGRITDYIDNLPVDTKFRFMAQAGQLIDLKKLMRSLIKKLGQDAIEVMVLINSIDEKKGKTALHLAIEQKQSHMILYLICIGVDKNIQDFELNTPLHSAVMLHYLEGVLLLLFGETDELRSEFEIHFKGARMDIVNADGYTPKKIAQLIECKEIGDAFERAESSELKKNAKETSDLPDNVSPLQNYLTEIDKKLGDMSFDDTSNNQNVTIVEAKNPKSEFAGRSDFYRERRASLSFGTIKEKWMKRKGKKNKSDI